MTQHAWRPDERPGGATSDRPAGAAGLDTAAGHGPARMPDQPKAPPPFRRGDGRKRWPAARWQVPLLVLLIGWTLAGLTSLAFGVHRIEDDVGNNPEIDGYAERADAFLRGELPTDAFRPLLYPALAALAGWPAGDGFTGARIVSVLSAGLLLWAVWRLGCDLASPGVGIVALLLVATNPQFVVAGVRAASDLTATLLQTVCLLCIIRIGATGTAQAPEQAKPGGPSYLGWTLLAGAAFGLAFSTRYPAACLLPVAAWALHGSARPWRGALWFGVAAVIAFLPQATANTLSLGSPLANDNHCNLAMRHFGTDRWHPYLEAGRAALGRDLCHHWRLVACNVIDEFYHYCTSYLAGLMGGGAGGFALLAMTATGWWTLWRRCDRGGRAALLFPWVFLAGVVGIFWTTPRIMLPQLPVLTVCAAAGIRRPGARWPRAAGWGLAVLIVLIGWRLHGEVRRYIAAHPSAEAHLVERLVATHGMDLRLGVVCPFLRRVGPKVTLVLPAQPATATVAIWLEGLREFIRTHRLDAVVLGNINRHGRNLPLGLADPLGRTSLPTRLWAWTPGATALWVASGTTGPAASPPRRRDRPPR